MRSNIIISSLFLLIQLIGARDVMVPNYLQYECISISTRKKRPGVLYSNVWMRGLGNFIVAFKEIGGKKNVVTTDNATHFMDCKEIERNSVTRN